MNLRALGCVGGNARDIANAVRYAAGLENDAGVLPRKKADIINLSLSSTGDSRILKAAIQAARAEGVIVIAAAGNSANAQAYYPVFYDGVIGVSAVDGKDKLAAFSNFGSAIDLTAPGGKFAGSDGQSATILSQTDYRYTPNKDADLDATLDAAEHKWLYQRLNDAAGHEEKVINLAFARKGQGIFRSRVKEVEDGWRGSGMKDHQYLQVWHIKPWSVANNVERLDGNNGLLLSPHIGFLFVRGYVTFSGESDMIVSHQLGDDIAANWKIMNVNKRQFTHKQKDYLRYHRENIFMC